MQCSKINGLDDGGKCPDLSQLDNLLIYGQYLLHLLSLDYCFYAIIGRYF